MRPKLICDAEGVPRFVQKMVYDYGRFTITVTYFDSQVVEMDPGYEVDLMDRTLTGMQRLDCERWAESKWLPRRDL